jgi:hypothetical protein
VLCATVLSSKTSSKSLDDCGYSEIRLGITFPYTEAENRLFSGV